MKKFVYSMLVLAMTAFTFTSCSDVPMPYDDPNEGAGDTPDVQEPMGDGTLENPFNVAGVNEFIEAGINLDKTIYIKGIVSATKEISPSFGNATFYISDDGTTANQFYVYRCFGLNNAKITSEDEVKVGDEVVICGKVTNYNGTYETVQNSAYIYSINGQTSGNGGGTTGEAMGDGTQANPYNSVAANQLASSLASGAESDYVYIKGKISSIRENYDNSFGNATFYISDDGTSANEFYVFRALYLNNEKYTSGTLPKVGDEVVIYAKVTNYMGNTPETVQGACYLYSLNGKTTSEGGGTTPGGATGDGTLTNPYNSVAANELASSLASGAESDYVYIKGKVSSIKENYDNSFGNATFYISDDGTSESQFYVFRALYLNNEKYTSGDLLSVGDDVVIYAKVTNYMGNTPETVQGACYLYSLTSNGGSGSGSGGEVSGNSITITASGFGLGNGEEVGTQSLSDGTTLTFDGGGNSNAPKYYDNGTNIRMYPKNSVTIKSSKKIVSVVINCDEASGVICNAGGEISASPGSVNVNDKVVTVNSINSTQATITNTNSSTGTASQIRFVSMTINYAE